MEDLLYPVLPRGKLTAFHICHPGDFLSVYEYYDFPSIDWIETLEIIFDQLPSSMPECFNLTSSTFLSVIEIIVEMHYFLFRMLLVISFLT